MTKAEFIANTAALFMSHCAGNPLVSRYEGEPSVGTDAQVAQAMDLAEALEKQGNAPWLEKSPQQKELSSIVETMKEFAEGVQSRPAPDLTFNPIVVVQVQAPGAALAGILRDIAGKLPPNAGLLPGPWEIGFRAASMSDAGILMPGGKIN